MNSTTDGNVTRINQEDYNKYGIILFKIAKLKETLDEPNNVPNETIKNYYIKLLEKKLYLDEHVFKEHRPLASRRINTLDELQKLQTSDQSSQQPVISAAETMREWLNHINSFRLNDLLWPRIGLASEGSFSLISKSDPPNAYFGVFGYALNVIMTLTQAAIHANNSISHDKVQGEIQTSGLRFLEMHKYKFINDFLWAPINAFYFMNQTIATCRNYPIIGDAICVGLFFIDILIGIYQQYETDQNFIELQLEIIDLVDSPSTANATEFDNELKKTGFEPAVIDKLKQKFQNVDEMNDSPIYRVLQSLQKQKEKSHWEHQKNIYLSMCIALAMSTLILSDIITQADFNFLFFGSIFAIFAKLCFIAFNYNEKNKDTTDPSIIAFSRQQLCCQMMQQLSFMMVFLITSLVLMPMLHDNSNIISWVLMSLCILASWGINTYLQTIIDRPLSSNSDENNTNTPLLANRDSL